MFDNKFNQYRTEVCPEIQISIMKIIYKICISETNLVYFFQIIFINTIILSKKSLKLKGFQNISTWVDGWSKAVLSVACSNEKSCLC